MIITTHAVVAAAAAYSLTNNPLIAFLIGVLSHFILDAIPHWDYTLNTNKPNPTLRGIALDVARVSLDLFVAFFLVFLFVQKMALFNPIIWAGVLGGIAPDIFQFLEKRLPKTPLLIFTRLHDVFHTKTELRENYILGALFQLLLIVLILFWL